MIDPTEPIEPVQDPSTTELLPATPPPEETRVYGGPVHQDSAAPAAAIVPGPLGLLGPYQLLAVTSQDEVSTVYQGFEPLLQRRVAVEVLAPALAALPDVRAQFVRQARATAAVVHPYIVTIHAIEDGPQPDAAQRGTSKPHRAGGPMTGDVAFGNEPYVVSEFLPGGSLQQRLDRGEALAVRTVLDLAQQLAEGLAGAHAAGLVHGDLRPACLLLDEAQHDLKITGFGRDRVRRSAGPAEVDGDAAGRANNGEQARSPVGVPAGQPHYLSPEQARGQEADFRSDLGSLGSVLYALCTGRPPFRAENRAAVLQRIREEPPRTVVSLNPAIPTWFSDLIARLQAQAPEQRSASAAAVAEVLREKLGPRPLPAAARPGRKHRLGVVLAATLLLAALAGALFLKAQAGGDGTLVAVVESPHVRVTIAAQDTPELGVGTHQVSLPPGVYTVQAVRNGRRVWEEVVTVEAGRRSEVRVPARPGREPAQPFVIVGNADREDQVFPTLAAAVSAAEAGDTIEIHGDGPWETPPLDLGTKPLTIRAATGFHPVVQLEGDKVDNSPTLIETKANLVLEGLELRKEGYKDPEKASKVPVNKRTIVLVLQGQLLAANCRFRTRHFGNCISLRQPTAVEVRNCELLRGINRHAAIAWSGSPAGGTLVCDNCVSRSGHFVYLSQTYQAGPTWALTFRNNTLVDSVCLAVISTSKDWPAPPAEVLVPVEASGNVFDATTPLQFEREIKEEETPPSRREREELLSKLVRWNESRNVYPPDRELVVFSKNSRHLDRDALRPQRTLQDLLQLWGKESSDSLQAKVRTRGRATGLSGTAFDDQSPDSFRLQPDSPGKGRGPESRDRGADVDLVGPGPGYEHFQKTAEYQEWLKRTRELFVVP